MKRIFRLRPLPPRDDAGVALITVILMLALMSALTLTIATVTTNNLVSARLSQQAGAALNASDAGISQAVSYLRKVGVRPINSCSPTCSANPWGNSTTPATVSVSGKAGQSYRVWIEKVAPYPANKPGIYRIHSTGSAGGGAARAVTVDVLVNGLPFVYGVVADSVSSGGDVGVHNESVFAATCVSGRTHIDLAGMDLAYGIPAAVHSSGSISTSNGSCSGSFIHNPGAPCDATFPYDTDSRGGALGGYPSCYNKARAQFGNLPQFNDPDSIAYNYPTSSYDSLADLARFSVKRPPFTQAQLDQLRTIAQDDGTYYTSANGFTVPSGPDAVMYFDLTATNPGGKVNLNSLAVAPWNRDPNPAVCPAQSLLVIIEGGDASMNSGSSLAAGVFLLSDDPYGNIGKGNGTATLTGSLYANNIDVRGTIDLWMDQCFMDNPPPALMSIKTYNYREVDR